MTDSHYRQVRYVEVVYLKNMEVEKIRREHYSPEEAESIYSSTVKKFVKIGQQALVMIREENHQLIKSEQVNYGISQQSNSRRKTRT